MAQPVVSLAPAPAPARDVALVLGTVGTLLLAAFALSLGYAREATLEAFSLAGVTLLGVGKFLPFWSVMGESRFSPWELALLVWVVETLVAVAVVYGSESLCRVGVLSRLLGRVRARAQAVLGRHPIFARCAVAGLVAFVMLPLAGTGAAIGTVLGTLIGLPRHVVLAAVSTGAALGSLAMAAVASSVGGAATTWDLSGNPPALFGLAFALVVMAAWCCRPRRQ